MNALDHMLGLADGEYDLLDDHIININMNKNNIKMINDENSFVVSSKAAPLTILNANDKIKPRGLRANDSDRNSNCNSPIPGLNRSKMNDSKPKNDHNNKIIRVNNSDGVRFNEDVQINTINSNDNNNISIFSPEVAYSDHLTRLAGHTPFVESNNSLEEVGRKYVDMHNFNYDVKWSPQNNSPTNNTTFNSASSKSCVMPNPNVNETSIINKANNNAITNSNTNFSPSFLITNNNGYNFNDSVDMNANTVINSRTTPNNDVNINDDRSYNFKSISIDALTCAISPNAITNSSPNIVDYLEQDEIKKHEESPQISQRITFKRETPIVIQHVINQNLTPRSVNRSTSAPPTRMISNFNNNSPYSNSPINASNASNCEKTNVQSSGRRVCYDDIVCSPYNINQRNNVIRRKIPSTPHPIKPNDFQSDMKIFYSNANIVSNNIVCNNTTSMEGEDTGVSRARPGLGGRKINKSYSKAKPETIVINPQSISYPNPPSAIKVVNPSVSGPDKKQKPFSIITNNTVATNTNFETAVENAIVVKCDSNNCDENPNDVSIQCPSVRDNGNADSVNFDDNSSFENDYKGGLDDLISPNPNPIKTLLTKIPSSNTNLGAASRIPKNTNSCDKLKSSLKQEFDVKVVDLNVTFSEDTLSVNESVFEPIFTKVNPITTADTEKDDVMSSSLSELNTSAAMTCVTTLTLDSFDDAESNSFDIGHKTSTTSEQKTGPRLNLTSKKVKKDDFEDMKEVTMLTTPGEFTTIMLEFGNKKSSRQTIFSKATCMRFDPINNSDNNDDTSISDTFQVSPHMLDIPLNSHKSVYVTFAPGSHKEGIYTGVLKIKNGKKSFVLMLRGEARYPMKKQTANNITNENNRQSTRVYDDYDFEISDDENEIKNIDIDNNRKDRKNNDNDNCDVDYDDDNDGPLLGLNLDLARPPDYTKINDLLSKTSHYSMAANTYDFSNTNTKIVQNDVKKSSRFDNKINYTNPNNYINGSCDSYSNNNAYPNIKVNDSIAEKVASDLLKVRQKVIKDWLGKENTKRRENRVITSPSISSSYSNIFSVLSKNSSTYQPTPSNTNGINCVAYNEINASNINPNTSCKNTNAYKYDLNSASKAAETVTSSINTTNSSKKTMYSSLGLKSNNLTNTSNIDGITNPSVALFFRRQSVSFGPVAVGTLARVKVELCNGSDKDVSVLIGDPTLPFVLLHNEVHVKARSYVRIPLRFVPVFHNSNGYKAELIAQSTDGQMISKIILSGNTFY